VEYCPSSVYLSSVYVSGVGGCPGMQPFSELRLGNIMGVVMDAMLCAGSGE
jgi:hypothetical protein